MNEIKTQIRASSTQASQLSQKACEAFRAKDFTLGKQLMTQAVAASKNCQKLIREYTQQLEIGNW